ncbi:hypothetical protein CSV86_014465 [Pseudomonas putida CSV86]|uniref:Uncharacterized protein n=1 Tax=Pseudomonas bharatica CSV86 TaxID=1005395 RepID=L1M8I6_9PSED|nr:hypothetical protein [Pseudomonas bharatica]NNJ16329.1 hypothetical protein [Pseudomonas bharatica CSV86]
MRILFAVMGLALLAGCTTSPVSSDKAKAAPLERIIYESPAHAGSSITVTRDTGWIAGGGCYVGVLIDGKLAARIATGETVTFRVSEGRHILGLSGDPMGNGLCGLEIGQSIKESSADLKQGESQRFRISGDTNSGLDLRPTSL